MKSLYTKRTVSIVCLGLSALATGCGGQAYRTQPDSPGVPGIPGSSGQPTPGGTSAQIPGGGVQPQNPGTGTTSVTPNPTPTSTTSNGGSAGFIPTLSESFDLTGSSGTKPTYNSPTQIMTDNLLKVKISAGPAGAITVAGSGYSAPYRCVTFVVTIGGISIEKTVSVDMPDQRYTACAGAPHSEVIDFSGRLSPGHGALTMSITAKGYDFQCQYFQERPDSMPVNGVYLQNINPAYSQQFFAAGLQTYCSKMSPVASVHTVSGSIEIQTNVSKGI